MTRKLHLCVGVMVVAMSALAANLCRADDATRPLLRGGNNVQGMWNTNDALGNQWDIHLHYGYINQGTQYIYSNAMYLYVDNTNFRNNNNQGILSKDGQEVQIGPWNHNGLQIYRRIRIFKKQGIARWMDIYVNPTNRELDVNARVRIQMNYGTRTLVTNSGNSSVGPKDFAFYTLSHGPSNAPGMLHIPRGPESEMQARIDAQHGRIEYHYSFKVPAGETMIIAYLEGQNRDINKLQETMKQFQADEYFSDLRGSVRRMVMNFDLRAGSFDIDLPRSTKADRITLRGGDPLYGQIANESFAMETAFGLVDLPAEDVLGISGVEGRAGQFQAILADGQLVCGQMPQQIIQLEIPSVGTQAIPVEDILNFSFQVSEARPLEVPFQGPYLMLNAGDRLAFDPASVELQLQRPEGVVGLSAAGVMGIILTGEEGGALHRVNFRNGSQLSGMLMPDEFRVDLRLQGPQTIRRDQLARIDYALDAEPQKASAKLDLVNGDKLFGRLKVDSLTIENPYGTVEINPSNVEAIVRSEERPDWVKIVLWNESVLSGKLQQEQLAFQIVPGPTVTVSPEKIKSLRQPNALPPGQIIDEVEKLVAQLGSESYQDRESAQQKLSAMDANILPILEKHQATNDPEVRQRLKEIIEVIKAK